MNGSLIRDKIAPELQDKGCDINVKVLNSGEFHREILNSIAAEVAIIQKSEFGQMDQTKLCQRIVEIETLLRTLAEVNKIPVAAIETVYNNMLKERGGYGARLYLERLDADKENTDKDK